MEILQFTVTPSLAAAAPTDVRIIRLNLRHTRPAKRQVEDLTWIQEPIEFVQQLGALVAPTLWVDEHDDRLRSRRRNRLHDENLAGVAVRVMVNDHVMRRPVGDDDVTSGSGLGLAASSASAAAGAVALLERRLLPATD